MRRTISLAVFLLLAASIAAALGVTPQTSLTNDDVISLKKSGISDEVIILKITTGPTRFVTEPADLIALKNAGVSDAVIAAMLRPTAGASLDFSRAAVILAFESSVANADAAGLPDATRGAIMQILKSRKVF